ncbi:probable disease resistance protein At5g66910 [Selaginella moellendorffii]|nr:probable disease resistance protein At5g66910 [Selaginella moellendorffii]|eukprot:XP_024536182.1 probable disease resistance protein At5g66910 [Selaginella moellendorffii]
MSFDPTSVLPAVIAVPINEAFKLLISGASKYWNFPSASKAAITEYTPIYNLALMRIAAVQDHASDEYQTLTRFCDCFNEMEQHIKNVHSAHPRYIREIFRFFGARSKLDSLMPILNAQQVLERPLPLVHSQKIQALGSRPPHEFHYRCQPPSLPPGINYLIVGRDEEFSRFKSLLLDEGRPERIGLFGPSGVGKTFLVTHLCRDGEIASHFDGIIWISFDYRERFDTLVTMQADILSRLTGNDRRVASVANGSREIFNFITRSSLKRYMLVLDNVWKKNWLHLLDQEGDMGRGNKVVAIASNAKLFPEDRWTSVKLDPLSFDDGYKLICMQAFGGEDQVPDTLDRDYVEKVVWLCNGVPKALQVMGRYMRRNKDRPWFYWQRLLEKINRWELDEWKGIFEMVKLSFMELDEDAQLLFLSLALLRDPWDESSLFHLWRAMRCSEDDNLCFELHKFNDAICRLEDASFGQRQWGDQIVVDDLMMSFADYIIDIEPLFFTTLKICRDTQGYLVLSQPNAEQIVLVNKTTSQPLIETPSLRFLRCHVATFTESFLGKLLELRYLHLESWCSGLWNALRKLSKLEALRIVLRGREADAVIDLSFLHGMHNLSELYIYYYKLSVVNFEFVRKLRKLKVLRLEDKHLNVKYDGKLRCPKEDLILSKNALELFKTFSGSKMLTMLHLGAIILTELPCHINFPRLTSLQIMVASKSLPPSFEELQNLESLELDGCGVLEEVPRLGRLCNLRQLKISGCPTMERIPDSALQDGLVSFPRLERLSISDCPKLAQLPHVQSTRPLVVHLDSPLPALRQIDEQLFIDYLIIDNCGLIQEVYVGKSLRRDLSFSTRESIDDIPVIGNLTLGERTSIFIFNLIDFSTSMMLHIMECEKLLLQKLPKALPMLRKLSLDKVTSLVEINDMFLPRLERLTILHCEMLHSISARLPSLKELVLQNLPYLSRINMQSDPEAVSDPDKLHSVPALPSTVTRIELVALLSLVEIGAIMPSKNLEMIIVSDCEKLRSLPAQSLNATTADHAKGYRLVLKNLPSLVEIGQGYSMSRVSILHCEKLHRVPSISGMTELRLKSLPFLVDIEESCAVKLYISDCQQLQRVPPMHGLERLSLKNLPSLIQIDRGSLSTITHLKISGCEKLDEAEQIVQEWEESDDDDGFQGLTRNI